MARITVEDCLKEVKNRFLLVHLAVKRTKQLKEGAEFTIDATDNKEVVNALREIAAGEVSFENIRELGVPAEDLFDSYDDETEKDEPKKSTETSEEKTETKDAVDKGDK